MINLDCGCWAPRTNDRSLVSLTVSAVIENNAGDVTAGVSKQCAALSEQHYHRSRCNANTWRAPRLALLAAARRSLNRTRQVSLALARSTVDFTKTCVVVSIGQSLVCTVTVASVERRQWDLPGCPCVSTPAAMSPVLTFSRRRLQRSVLAGCSDHDTQLSGK